MPTVPASPLPSSEKPTDLPACRLVFESGFLILIDVVIDFATEHTQILPQGSYAHSQSAMKRFNASIRPATMRLDKSASGANISEP